MTRRLIVTLNVDQDDLYAASRPSHARYATKVGAEHVTLTGRAGWKLVVYEKWRYRKWVAAADRTIVLDTDTWIHPDCPNLFDVVPETHIGLNRVDPWVMSEFGWRGELVKLCESQDVPVPPGALARYWNCGVWVGSRRHADYWAPPPRPDKLPGHWCDEEQWGKVQACRHGWPVLELDKRYNYQWYLDRDFGRLIETRPWIVHLAGLGQVPGEAKWRVALMRLLEYTVCGRSL